MRIRKHASKILGTTSVCPSYSPPPPPPPAQSWSPWTPHGDTGLVCELNQSPWDVMSFLPRPAPNHLHAGPQEMEMEIEGAGDVLGNGIKCKEIFISSNPSSIAAISARDEEKEGNDKMAVESNAKRDKKRRRLMKDESFEAHSAATEAAVINTRCKKSDGKTWKCKRRAQHPHTLCEYHLNQLRSYNYNSKPAHKVEAPRAQVKKRRKTMAQEEAGSNYVYYYNGFGPWRGKRRSGDGEGAGAGSRVTKEEEEEQEEDESKENLESEDGRNAPAVGDGHDAPIMYDDMCKDEDEAEDNQEGCGDTDGGGDSLEYNDEEENAREKRRNYLSYGKGRRKRVKARSLKSLL